MPTTSQLDASTPVAPESSAQVLRRFQSQSRYVFREDEFARHTGRIPGSPASQLALQRLSKAGHIVLAQKNPARWLIVPAEQAHYGAPPVEWWLTPKADTGVHVIDDNWAVAYTPEQLEQLKEVRG